MDQFEVVVSKTEALTPRIREFVLARPNGAPMPGWAAGAHIDVHLPDVGRRQAENCSLAARSSGDRRS